MIKRYLNAKNLTRTRQDFGFLIKMVQQSEGEFDFAIRQDYFNLYYKGNSMVKVSFPDETNCQISIHHKFFDGTLAEKKKKYHSITRNKDYYLIDLLKNEIHPFLQKRHLDEFASRIKSVNYGEEIGFEQALITDNLGRSDFFFIDRQVTDSGLARKRMDLLALKKIAANQYQFVIVEVKLGNNPELNSKVALQLDNYISHIRKHFPSYKECYERQYRQKSELGLLNSSFATQIEIIEPVVGWIVVGGYSGIAKKRITQLESQHPDLIVKHFKYVL